MNREIKFRVYSTIGKHRMIYLKNGSLKDLQETENWNVMQFTGLKDINEKEIYEGDIVTHLHSADTCVVVFQKETAMFLAEEIGDEELGFGIEDVIEVIGNIYENADLLSDLS